MVGFTNIISRKRAGSMHEETSDREEGGISFQGILVLVLVIIIIVIAISLVQVIQVPLDLENSVKENCKQWLRLTPYQQHSAIPGYTKMIKETVATVLKNQTYNPKELKINFVNLKNITVYLPYTVNIEIFGFKFKFAKILDLDENAYSF